MRKNYETPQIEVIEIEIEDTLCASQFGVEDSNEAGSILDWK